MRAFFPIAEEQVNDEAFKSLTPAEKLYYWLLVSEYNYYMPLNGNFSRSDSWFAAALSLSLVKVRQARRKFQKLGWIAIKQGYKAARRNFATEYLTVKWSRPPGKGNGRFAQMHRHAFHMLLRYIFQKRLTIADLVIYTYMNYWRSMNGETDSDGDYSPADNWFITKQQLRELTGIQQAVECVDNLFKKFTFSTGEHLFGYEDKYTKLSFADWAEFSDPSSNEGAKNSADSWEKEIKQRAVIVSLGFHDSKELGEKLLENFAVNYELLTNKPLKVLLRDSAINQFANAGIKYGIEQVEKHVAAYISQTKKPTVTDYISYVERQIKH